MSTTPQRNQRIALVTGSNKGIGKAIAAGLAQAGFTVFPGARDQDRGLRAVKDLAGDGDVRLVNLEVTDADSVRAAAGMSGW